MSLVGKALVRGALLSFLLRIFSFLLTQITIRLIDPIALGHASIKLELVLNTCLFIGREGFRLTFMKLSTSSDDDDDSNKNEKEKEHNNSVNVNINEKTNNVIWLSIPAGIVTSILSLVLYLKLHKQNPTETEGHSDGHNNNYDHELAGILYCTSAILETISEPIVILCIRTLDVDTRAIAEGMSSFIKSITSVILLNLSISKDYPVSCLGLSQLVYSILLSLMFYTRKWDCIVWPTSIIQTGFDIGAIQSVIIFTFQGLFKHCLTEGDRIVLTIVADGYSQGVFAMVTSYGGIVSRVLLQPIEENARIYFAQKQQEQQQIQNNNNSSSISISILSLEESYYTLIKLVLYIGFIFATIASNYTYVLLSMLAGRRWSENIIEASNALSAFCFYILTMSLNGMTEAFVYGIISGTTSTSSTSLSSSKKSHVGKLGLVHGIVGTIFAIIAPILVRYYSTIGLILSNCIAMILRSLYSICFASNYFNKKNIFTIFKNILPNPIIVFTFIISYIITYLSYKQSHYLFHGTDGNDNLVKVLSKEWVSIALRHVGIGISCVIVILTAFILYEKQFIASLKNIIYPENTASNGNTDKKNK